MRRRPSRYVPLMLYLGSLTMFGGEDNDCFVVCCADSCDALELLIYGN